MDFLRSDRFPARLLKRPFQLLRYIRLFTNWPEAIRTRLRGGDGLITYRFRDGRRLTGVARTDAYVVAEVIVCASYDGCLDLPTPGYVWDIGANIGSFVVWAAAHWPEAEYHSFEPAPKTVQLLERNCADNPGLHWRVHPFGLAGHDSTVIARSPSGRSTETSVYETSGEVVEFPLRGIGSVWRELGSPRIDLCKMDCEGGEYDIFAEIPDELLMNIRTLVLELHPVAGHEREMIRQRLVAAGFRVEWSDAPLAVVRASRAAVTVNATPLHHLGMAARFVEISYVPIVSRHLPAGVLFIDTRFRTQQAAGWRGKLGAVFDQAKRLLRVVFQERPEVVFCRRPTRFLYFDGVSKTANVLRWLMWLALRGAVTLLRWRGAELVVLDLEDQETLDRPDLALLRHCRLYFKRELPQNAWSVFQRVIPAHQELSALTRNPAFRPLVAKFRPLPLGISDEKAAEVLAIRRRQNPRLEKTVDVFFAGGTSHSTVRSAGLPELERLRAAGLRVDWIETGVDFTDFVDRMSRAWLVWSPEGSGWDCFRHYEAVLAGAVPVINYPRIRQLAPLTDCEHCFYYPPEPGGLEKRVNDALRDRGALRDVQARAQGHVITHLLHGALGRYVLAETGCLPD